MHHLEIRLRQTDRQTDIQYMITDGLRSDQDAGALLELQASCERFVVCWCSCDPLLSGLSQRG